MRDPRREAQRWMTQAEVDLAAARHLAVGFASLACFHAQQAAEKAPEGYPPRGRRALAGEREPLDWLVDRSRSFQMAPVQDEPVDGTRLD